jgi:hypothetical protein
MKTLIITSILFLFSGFIIGYKTHFNDYKLTVCNGSGLTYMETYIYCDSFKMASTQEVKFWKDGKEQTVLATDCIRVETN